MTGLGRKATDKNTHTSHNSINFLTTQELTSIYSQEGLGHRIVTALPKDATKNGFNILGDDEADIERVLYKHKTIQTFKQASVWARLYGGALILMDFKDNHDWETPLNTEKPGELRKLRVYPSPRIDLASMERVQDPKSDYFEEYEYYIIKKLDGGSFRVHRSRVLLFTGIELPQVKVGGLNSSVLHWGIGILDLVYSYLAPLGACTSVIPTLLQESTVTIFRLSNLAELIAEDNYNAIDNRMTAIQLQKSIINAVLLGEGEEFERNTLNFGGFPDMLDRMLTLVASVTNIPKAILFGRESAGLSSSQEEDTSRYYDAVIEYQTDRLVAPLQTLVTLVNNSLGKKVKDDILVATWEHPRPETQTEKLTNREKQAQIDAHYINLGVYSADDVARSRFYSGYSYDTTIEDYQAMEGDD
jgi:phage-related protein (TIGR01555 family)